MRRSPTLPIPSIPPVPPGVDRPSWSVMIPTYQAGPLFEQTLRSILEQDPGPDRMQIAVVDDRSKDRYHEQVIERLAPGRVEIHVQPVNVGLARNWNGCIERARGRWVHILHQDDYVLPGFYERLALADAEPSVGAAFSRHRFVDGDDRQTEVSKLQRPTAGVLEAWLGTIVRIQQVQCPSIVVRREAYQRLGGFRLDLVYALDWEMWVRLASAYDYWFEPEPLACYRIHAANETARLRRDDSDLRDIRRAIKVMTGHLPGEVAAIAGVELRHYLRDEAMQAMYGHLGRGDARSALLALRRLHRCDRSWAFRGGAITPLRWAAKLLLADALASRRRRAGSP